MSAPAELEPLRAAVARSYQAANRCPPCEDAALSAAARQIAGGPWTALPDPLTRQRIVEQSGGGDPAPRALMAEGEDWQVVAQLVETELKGGGADNVYGVGVVNRSAGVRAVVLRGERKVLVEHLPARIQPGEVLSVRGRFLAKLSEPAIYVEAPDGSVSQIEVVHDGAAFRGRFIPRSEGRYAIEVMAHGEHGPEVEYLRPVLVGDQAEDPVPPPVALGADDAPAVLDAINAERQRFSAVALASDPRLAKVAQAYAEEMRESGVFGHVSARSGDLVARLKHAKYSYRRAGENLAQGPSALEAYALTADSPAHRKTMLDPQYNRCGIGISRVLLGDSRADVILVEVFARD